MVVYDNNVILIENQVEPQAVISINISWYERRRWNPMWSNIRRRRKYSCSLRLDTTRRYILYACKDYKKTSERVSHKSTSSPSISA